MEEIFFLNDDTQNTELETEVTSEATVEVHVDEGIGWVGTSSNRHDSLSGRNEPEQHSIGAIIGLRDELDQIEALKTVRSNNYNNANYYEWNGAIPSETGYFVSLVNHTDKIEICTGSDIFGVTVDSAGFVGGDNEEQTKASISGLVVTSGLVCVKCESGVVEGDYVVSDAYGMAAKTESGCGYKVIAIGNQNGASYAYISLGVQACTTDALGKKVDRLDSRVEANETNIAAVMQRANEAYAKAEGSVSSSEDMNTKLDGVINKVDEIDGSIDSIISKVDDGTQEAISRAEEIANEAKASAEAAKQEAIEASNSALEKAGEIEKMVEPITTWVDSETGNTGTSYYMEYIENGLNTKADMETVNKLDEENKSLITQNAENYTRMLSSINKYCIGEYSQAYGLTAEQAKKILSVDMVYIPLRCDGEDTHKEAYGSIERSFTYGFYYKWTADNLWSEKPVGKVWFSETQPAGNSYDYWCTNDTLYLLNDGEWVEVATLAGSVNTRITSIIRQDVDGISAEIVNACGGVTLSERLSNIDASIASSTFWGNDDGKTYATVFKQTSDEDNSSLTLAAYKYNTSEGVGETTPLTGANIVLSQDDNKSHIYFDADHITLDGETTFTTTEGGKTKINGGNIATDSIEADAINVTTLDAISADVGKITAGTLQSDNYKSGSSGMKLDLTNGTADITGKITATEGTIDNCTIDECTIGNCTINDTCTITGVIKGDILCEQFYEKDDENWTFAKMEFEGTEYRGQYNIVSENVFGKSTNMVNVGDPIYVPAEWDSHLSSSDYAILSDPEGAVTSSDSDGVWEVTAKKSGYVTIKLAYYLGEGEYRIVDRIRVYVRYPADSLIPSTDSVTSYLHVGGKARNEASIYLGAESWNGDVTHSMSFLSLTSGYDSKLSELTAAATDMDFWAGTGHLYGTWGADSAITTNSARKLKHDIEDIDERYLNLLNELQVRRFKYNNGTSERYHTGLIVDELKSAMDTVGLDSSELAAYCTNGSGGGIRYEELTVLCIKALQEMNAKVEKLSKEVEELRSKIAD